MDREEGERDRGFKVQDRRRFSADGEAREESRTEAPTTPTESAAAAPTPPPEQPAAGEPGDATQSPAIDFATFIISLSAQALTHLGEIPDPIDRVTRVDLEAARQIIDILGMLGEKTRGNLDPAESTLLENALYDLRMKYVDRTQRR
jgi:hypothetical protein